MKIRLCLMIVVFLLFVSACSKGTITDAVVEQKLLVQQEVVKTGLGKGNIPPDFTITSTDGKSVNLRSFQNENMPVLVYFMATWCPFCARDFAVLSEIYSLYEKDVPIVVMSLDLSEDNNILKEYKKRYPLLDKIEFGASSANTLSAYQVKHTTTKYAIGRDGAILYSGSGAFDVNQWKILLEALKSS